MAATSLLFYLFVGAKIQNLSYAGDDIGLQASCFSLSRKTGMIADLSTSASSYMYFTYPSHTTGKLFWWHFDPHITTLQILWALTKKCSLANFRNKLPSDLLLIWQICSAISANDLINFGDQTILKWPFSKTITEGWFRVRFRTTLSSYYNRANNKEILISEKNSQHIFFLFGK